MGKIRQGKDHGLAKATRAVDVSSAASRTAETELPHSSRADAKKPVTTYGSTGLPTISHNARMIKRLPSRAFGGVVFPRFESVPPEFTLVAPDTESLSILAKLTDDELGRRELPVVLPIDILLNKLCNPSGNSIRCNVLSTSHFFKTNGIPNAFVATAKSAAAQLRSRVVLAERGLLFSITVFSPNARRNNITILSFLPSSSNSFSAITFSGRFNSEPLNGGAVPRCAAFFLAPTPFPIFLPVVFVIVVFFTLNVVDELIEVIL
mmetsp:Transcript_41901/g.47611  ORF Transcript_41901/g.47611 Transcript_41901/m.47611 type:complete len:264 (+) Transcript_41901:1041-1832(+)